MTTISYFNDFIWPNGMDGQVHVVGQINKENQRIGKWTYYLFEHGKKTLIKEKVY